MPVLIATEGLDFARLSRTVTLTPTDAQQCVIVTIEDDLELEETESLIVSVSLTGIVDSVLLSQHTASISIVDNDRKQPIVSCALCGYTVLLKFIGRAGASPPSRVYDNFYHIRTCTYVLFDRPSTMCMRALQANM